MDDDTGEEYVEDVPSKGGRPRGARDSYRRQQAFSSGGAAGTSGGTRRTAA
jgi:hypothetical protein